MASGSYRPWAAVCVIMMLALSQTWSCAAYNNQQQKWLTEHMTRASRSASTTTARVARHLGESTTVENGWRANLVNEDHRLHSAFNLSSVERIAFGVEKSKLRALTLDARARAALFSVGTGPGRKTLQTDDSSTYRVSKAPGLWRKALQTTASPSFEEDVSVTPGSYSMSFSIGTPAQNFVAIADTGSDLVWIQGAACTVCFDQSSPRFDATVSTTYTEIGCTTACNNLGSNQLQCTPNCQYTYSYGDQSSTVGSYALDTVTLSNSAGVATLVPDFQFGNGLQNQGTFTDTDGIIGLARGPISFPSQIASYLGNVNKFSYCLISRDNDTGSSPIIFGAAAVPANATGVSYTPLLTPYEASDVPYYYVNLLGITVGSTAVPIPDSALQIDASGNGGTIFDSGTTYTVLNTDAYTPVLNAFTTQITAYQQVNLSDQVGLDLCYDVSGFDRIEIPNLVFNFENATFDLPFENIFIYFSDGQSSYMCLTLLESQGLNIYGNTQQQNFQVVYEEDEKRIGWIPQDCGAL